MIENEFINFHEMCPDSCTNTHNSFSQSICFHCSISDLNKNIYRSISMLQMLHRWIISTSMLFTFKRVNSETFKNKIFKFFNTLRTKHPPCSLSLDRYLEIYKELFQPDPSRRTYYSMNAQRLEHTSLMGRSTLHQDMQTPRVTFKPDTIHHIIERIFDVDVHQRIYFSTFISIFSCSLCISR